MPVGATFDPATLSLRWTPDNGQAGEYVIHLRATDHGDPANLLVTDILVPVKVFNQNRRPVVTPIENITVAKDTVLTIPLKATDADGNPLVLKAINESPFLPLPAFITLTDNGDGTGALRIAPGANQRGDYTIIVVATDNGDGLGDPLAGGYSFNIKVTSPNEAPVIGYLGDAVAVIGQAMSIPVLVSDMDQDALTYAVSGLVGATLTPTAVYGKALLNWTPTAAQAGSYTAQVSVTDSGSGVTTPATTTASFKVIVRAANSGPQLVPIGPRQGTEAELLGFTLRATDPENDKLTFSMTGAPLDATLDPVTGAFAWTPARNASGTYAITFTASDGNLQSSETVTLTIANANQAPVFVTQGLQLVREGSDVVFKVVGADPDGDPLLLSVVTGLPQGALFVPATGEFQWTPGYDQAGDHAIKFRAIDPSGAATDMTVIVRVADINRAPVITEGYHGFLLGQEKRFFVVASDPDKEDYLSYAAEGMPEGATLDATTGEFVWTPGPGQAGDYVVTLLVGDGKTVTRRSIVMRALLEPIAPTVRLELTPSFPPVPGTDVLVHALADSLSTITSLRVWVDGTELVLDANNRAHITAGAPGKHLIVVTAIDADGATTTITNALKVRDPADKSDPVVSFNGALDGSIIAGSLAVAGLVDDTNLDSWTLELIDGAGKVTELATGSAPLTGTLGNVDARRLADGFYKLRLTARDISGRVSVTSAQVEMRSGADKLGRFTTQRTDLSAMLGTVPFSLVRQYDSLTNSWSFLGLDVDLQTSVSGAAGPAGALPGFKTGTRVYLTLPTGERTSFTFTPTEEVIGTQTFYRPAWVPDGSTGYTLQSVNVQLRKVGGQFYDVATGLAYNPAAPAYADHDYLLSGPDSTHYMIDSERGHGRDPVGRRAAAGRRQRDQCRRRRRRTVHPRSPGPRGPCNRAGRCGHGLRIQARRPVLGTQFGDRDRRALRLCQRSAQPGGAHRRGRRAGDLQRRRQRSDQAGQGRSGLCRGVRQNALHRRSGGGRQRQLRLHHP